MSVISANRSSGTKRSWKVSNARSTRPLPWGELAKMISIPSSSHALCICEKRSPKNARSINVQSFKQPSLLDISLHHFHATIGSLGRKEFSMDITGRILSKTSYPHTTGVDSHPFAALIPMIPSVHAFFSLLNDDV